jgi:DNA-3-methyladenine glycosylase II
MKKAAFQLTPAGPFSLAESKAFLTGFPAASGTVQSNPDDALRIAFVRDGGADSVGVSLRASGGVVSGDVVGSSDGIAVSRQVARIFSLDEDATAFPDIAQRDPVIASLLASHPGFRPVNFFSAYEAAVWAVLTQRTPMRIAANLKRQLALAHGEPFAFEGETLHAFPTPARLLAVPIFSGIAEEKLARLHAVARATEDGTLDAERLRVLSLDRARKEVRAVRGLGEWAADHVLMRGAGQKDTLPLREPRVLEAVAAAYGLEALPDEATLTRIAEAWRPYRMWVIVLLRIARGSARRARGSR